MDSFYALNKLLSKLPFSILGYYQHEKEIDSFFELLCESDFIAKKSNIKLVSYSYARLKGLNDWKTESLSRKFFFHALNEKYSLLILNLYYSFRDKLFNKTEDDIKDNQFHSNNVAIVLSRLFLKDVGFRLSYTTDKNWHFSLLEQNNVFSIKIPLSRILNKPNESPLSDEEYFKSTLSYFLSTAISAIDTENLNNLLVLKVPDSKSSYELSDNNKQSPIFTHIDNLRNAFKPKNEIEILRHEIVQAIYFWHITNPGYFTRENTIKHIENWVELFFQITIISLVYDSWIEYFPSVCGLDESEGAKQYRNLGGLILGYKTDAPITQEERSVFRIISARISSTVAGQWMFDNNKELRRDRNRIFLKKAFEEFEKLEKNTILHGENPVDESFLKSFNDYYDKYEKILTAEFKKSFHALLKNNNNYCSKYCLFELKGDYTACGNCKVQIKNAIFSTKRKKKCCNENSLTAQRFNIPLIKALLESLTTHKNSKKRASIKKEFSDNKIGMIITYKNGDTFNISEFIAKLKDKTHKGSFIGKFFCDYYDTLDCHGIFIMEYYNGSELLPFFNSRDSIRYVKRDEKTIEVNASYPFPADGQLSVNKIKVTFINEL
jgi:hypothetical protein